jgi:precorrin-4/cobalt-precorrin-4 C11-methyltransferase
MAVQVYFIGAGPGDPELITIKAKKIIEKADVIIYADSLVNPEVCSGAREGAEIHRSSKLNLEEITDIITAAVSQGKTVARLQSGDPAIYGAIYEQMAELGKKGIVYEVVPGVSSMLAAAAALKAELTVPELSQTVIVTRMEGRTPVPAPESLKSLAAHRASMAIFLSTSLVDKVSTELLAGGYSPDTPAVVVHRASWRDELVLRTTLKDLPEEVKKAGLVKQALIMVGDFLKTGERGRRSKLYDRNFKHEYR